MKRILTASYDQIQEVGSLIDLLGAGVYRDAKRAAGVKIVQDRRRDNHRNYEGKGESENHKIITRSVGEVKMTKTIIQIEDKQALLNAVQLALTEGEKFAKAMFDTLIEAWGADKYQIDQVGLIEVGTGHYIDCCMKKGIDLGDPAEYIAASLASYSDVGLKKCGLTRTQYEASRPHGRQPK